MAAIQAMKSSAVLINVARGEVVDQQALVEACASSQIAGAVLDVYVRSQHPRARLRIGHASRVLP